jgi:predicted nuclease of predicted toxin-antitoxin system
VKLLFDENLSHRLPALLADVFPDSTHLRAVGLVATADDRVWEFAKANAFAIVSKDDDFRQRSLVFGAPPKVIWVRLGNSSTAEIAAALRAAAQAVYEFDADPTASFFVLLAR